MRKIIFGLLGTLVLTCSFFSAGIKHASADLSSQEWSSESYAAWISERDPQAAAEFEALNENAKNEVLSVINSPAKTAELLQNMTPIETQRISTGPMLQAEYEVSTTSGSNIAGFEGVRYRTWMRYQVGHPVKNVTAVLSGDAIVEKNLIPMLSTEKRHYSHYVNAGGFAVATARFSWAYGWKGVNLQLATINCELWGRGNGSKHEDWWRSKA